MENRLFASFELVYLLLISMPYLSVSGGVKMFQFRRFRLVYARHVRELVGSKIPGYPIIKIFSWSFYQYFVKAITHQCQLKDKSHYLALIDLLESP